LARGKKREYKPKMTNVISIMLDYGIDIKDYLERWFAESKEQQKEKSDEI